jgi:hypothetical protein
MLMTLQFSWSGGGGGGGGVQDQPVQIPEEQEEGQRTRSNRDRSLEWQRSSPKRRCNDSSRSKSQSVTKKEGGSKRYWRRWNPLDFNSMRFTAEKKWLGRGFIALDDIEEKRETWEFTLSVRDFWILSALEGSLA